MGLSSSMALFDTETRPLKQQGADPITDFAHPLGLLLAFAEKKQMASCIYQLGYNEREGCVVFFSLWLCSRLDSEHNSKILHKADSSVHVNEANLHPSGFRKALKDYISQRSLRVCKVTALLKALEETPMLSRAAQKGVSTWVVRQLSHVITALAVSVTPIT